MTLNNISKEQRIALIPTRYKNNDDIIGFEDYIYINDDNL